MTASQGKTSATAGPGEAVAARADARRHQQAVAERAAGFSDMQCAAGNLAIQHLLRSGAIQAELTISQPDDGEEREADHVVAHVLAAPAAGVERAGSGALAGDIGLQEDLMTPRPGIPATRSAGRWERHGAARHRERTEFRRGATARRCSPQLHGGAFRP